MPNWDLRRGDRVLLRRLTSDFADMPREHQDILDLCVGRELEVRGLDELGRVELDVSRIASRGVGPRTMTVFVEAECLELLDR